MKRTLSVVLTAALLLGCTLGLSASAYNTRTDALLTQLAGSTEATVTFTAGNTLLGSSTDTVSIKNGAVSYEYKTGFLTVRVVVRDGVAYAYLPLLPFIYVEVPNLGFTALDPATLIQKATGLTMGILNYVTTYDEVIDGVAYTVEEYNDRAQVTIKFCYIADQLMLVRVTDARTNSIQNTYFENVSFSVSDSAVSVPTGFNLTPFLGGLASMLLASLAK